MTLDFYINKHETALLAQQFIDNDIEFTCMVAPFENKIISPKFINGKTYKLKIYGFKGHHGRNKSRILSAANVIKAIELGCWLSDKIFSRIEFKDKNPLNYHLENINIRFLEYQKFPYKPGEILNLHLGDKTASVKKKQRTRAIVTEMNGYKHETMYYRYLYETYLGEKLLDDVEIDHIDGDVNNNNISNLRPVSVVENRLKSKLCGEGITFLGKDNGGYKEYNFLKSCITAGPMVFANVIMYVRNNNANFVFPIITGIEELVNKPEWQDVLYYTYYNQIKLGINLHEKPELIETLRNFIAQYETVKTYEYLSGLFTNVYVPIYSRPKNWFKFQTNNGVTPFDKPTDGKYIDLQKSMENIPDLHKFNL